MIAAAVPSARQSPAAIEYPLDCGKSTDGRLVALELAPAETWVVQLVVPAGAVSTGMPVTVAPGSEDGVWAVQDPEGPLDVVRMIGPLGVAPTAAQTDRVALGDDSHEALM